MAGHKCAGSLVPGPWLGRIPMGTPRRIPCAASGRFMPAFDTQKPGDRNPPNATLPQPTPKDQAPAPVPPAPSTLTGSGMKVVGADGGPVAVERRGIEERLFICSRCTVLPQTPCPTSKSHCPGRASIQLHGGAQI
ncbi:unnamed protein product [Gadus morhua 'NCC']